jgi:hypothetical protein
MSESNDKDKSASKYNIKFEGPTSIQKQEIGDKTIHAATYNENLSMNVTVDNKFLEKMPKEYADSLQNFTNLLNSQLQAEKIQSAAVTPIQNKMNELAEETAKLEEKTADENKKLSIRERLKGVAMAIVKASPKIAKTLVSFTPLAPFSELVGETFESMVQNAVKS